MTTLLQANGTWNATPAALPDGTYPVVASLTDSAGNMGSATQTLAVLADALQSTGSTGGSTSGGGSTGASPTLMLWLPVTSINATRGKRVHVPFVLSGPATLTLTVLRQGKIAAVVSTRRPNGGRGRLTWNGKIKNKAAPAATYKIVVQAVSPPGDTTHATATLHITSRIPGANHASHRGRS